MTKKEALEGCIEMWCRIQKYDHTKYLNIEDIKVEVAKEMGVDWEIDCAMCEYDLQHSKEDCDNCLIMSKVWPEGCTESGPFNDIYFLRGVSDAKFFAKCQQIIDACQEVLDELQLN